MNDNLQLLSIALEAVIAVIFLPVALSRRPVVFGLALIFAIYVGYDLAKLLAWEVPTMALRGGFFVATVAALVFAAGLPLRA